jgi:preprotein translocase subunit SecE
MNKVAGFLKDVVEELKKVSWTTKDELIDSTIIVLVSLVILAVFTGVVDWALAVIIKKLMHI